MSFLLRWLVGSENEAKVEEALQNALVATEEAKRAGKEARETVMMAKKRINSIPNPQTLVYGTIVTLVVTSFALGALSNQNQKPENNSRP